MGQRRNQKGKQKNILRQTEKDNIAYQNLKDKANAVLIEKFIAITTYMRKEEISQINFTPQGKKKNKLDIKLAEGKK